MSDYSTRDTDAGMGETGTSGMNTGSTGTENTGSEGTSGLGSTAGMQEKLTQAREMVSDKVSQVSESMTRMSSDVTNRLRSGVDRMRTMDGTDLNLMYDDVLESARQNPGRTILISAAVGMVLGMFLRGTHRDY